MRRGAPPAPVHVMTRTSQAPSPPVDDLLQQVQRPEFWRALCPEARLSDHPFGHPFGGGTTPAAAPYPIDPTAAAQAVAQLRGEGYLQTGPLIPAAQARLLARCVTRVADRGIPAPFALVYDDLWEVTARIAAVIEPALGPGYRLLPDFWIWIVGPGYEAAGWAPHRDLEKPGTLRADGLPNLMTVWLPFTDATPLNSCIYVLPTHLDPNLPERAGALTIPPGSERHVRALPAQRGAVLAWNQYVLHWGSETTPWAHEPRISFAMYYQRGDVAPYDAGFITPAPGAALPFSSRLGIIGRMLLKYSYKYRFTDDLLRLCRSYVALWRRGVGGGAPARRGRTRR